MEKKGYSLIIVESFIPDNLRNRHGSVHIRPVSNDK